MGSIWHALPPCECLCWLLEHACIYTCMHAYTPACIYTFMHAYTLACMHLYIHACIFTGMHACTHACMRIQLYARIYTCMHANAHCIGRHSRVFSIGAHVYMYIYIHTHTYISKHVRVSISLAHEISNHYTRTIYQCTQTVHQHTQPNLPTKLQLHILMHVCGRAYRHSAPTTGLDELEGPLGEYPADVRND